MFDLGRAFLASVERAPKALAIVDGECRLSYAEWCDKILRMVAGLRGLGLEKGDRLLVVLQNRWEMATLHWACQLAGIVVTPINWRVKPDELAFYLENSEAKAIAFEPATREAVDGCPAAHGLPLLAVQGGACDSAAGLVTFEALLDSMPAPAEPLAGPEDVSLMLYTSGTTGQGKGVPRRHRHERAAAVAHVAQNLYGFGERTLGVMPLYHTMGVRSLLAMAAINGCFVCLPRFSTARALELIESEAIGNLYLVPTLYHDLLADSGFSGARVRTVRKLGFAGAAMTDGLLARLVEAFAPDLFVNHYGSSEIYTFTVDQNAAAKPGSAGKAGINQIIRVVRIGANDPDALCPAGEEGEIIASLAGDEAFEGYWRRPDADEKALRSGWYFTGDTGHFDADGDLFVTGRVDDMIITGGENVFPLEVESVLSLHPAVAEVAVVGLPDERWGKAVTAFVVCREGVAVTAEDLDGFCQASDLANFKRPRNYRFVEAIPKSPVGKILRRLLLIN